ncbi:hypothetical protein CAS74_002508 [Pichia kudriavzevii]|uniref:Redoxin domain-containing protein n=1 Tax=Pichia kudriavzevii TaxID=4909 RepID=A0A1Z8JQ75_PICKU|nr:hypothetical protein CAS74_002508 [Pichia kudriavzevii]
MASMPDSLDFPFHATGEYNVYPSRLYASSYSIIYLQPKIGDVCPYAPETIDVTKLEHPLLTVVVPGAFTPTCTENHIPPYLTTTAIDSLQNAGVKTVLILSVDSPFITRAWGDDLTRDKPEVLKYVQEGYIKFVSDAGAQWLSEVGLNSNSTDKQGKVTYVGTDLKRGSVEKSGIEAVLSALKK